jgi:hypothetical protein
VRGGGEGGVQGVEGQAALHSMPGRRGGSRCVFMIRMRDRGGWQQAALHSLPQQSSGLCHELSGVFAVIGWGCLFGASEGRVRGK